MSKSILIVICDFLLISLLSIANFDKPAENPGEAENEIEMAQQQSYADAEMVELLKMSLDNERIRRSEIDASVEELADTAEEQRKLAEEQKRLVAEREQALREREKQLREIEEQRKAIESRYAQIAEKSKMLETRVAESETRNAALQTEIVAASAKLEQSAKERLELEKRIGDMRETDSAAKARLEAAHAEIKKAQEQLAALQSESKKLKNENQAIALEKQALATQLEAEAVKTQIYEENLKRAHALVDIEKVEKEKILDHAETLAVGVSDLATSQKEMATTQKEITKEVRDLRPKTSSEIFEGIKNSVVGVNVNYTTTGLFGKSDKSADIKAIPVTLNGLTWLVFSSKDTGIGANLYQNYTAPESVSVSVIGKTSRFAPITVYSIKEDPRVFAVQVPAQFLEKEGITPLKLSQNFFAFPESVVVSLKNSYYGEVPFKADFKNDNYAQMDVGLIQSIFGTFSPSEGDLVLSRNGDYLGMMIGGDAAVLLKTFTPLHMLAIGAKYEKQRATNFVNQNSARYKQLPYSLQ